MVLKSNVNLLIVFASFLVLCVGIFGKTYTPTKIVAQKTIFINDVATEKSAKTKGLTVIVETIDDIILKQTEMRNTIVLISTRNSIGSGTIIDRIELDEEGLYEYRVLSNAHVTYPRLMKLLKNVNAITGKLNIQIIDTGCKIILFNYNNGKWRTIKAKVLSEDTKYDLAMLSFESKDILNVAKVANSDMLSRVRVFDNVFAIGCQLGKYPTPTNGIISQIIKGKNEKKEWIIYSMTSQITPGSSGGGLFKRYDGHYYIIGIPYRTASASNGKMIPHLAHAISLATASDFINENAVTIP